MTVRMKQSWDINSQVKSTVFEEKYSPLPLASQIVHWRPWDRIRVSSQKTEINPLAWNQLIWVMYFFRPLLAGGEGGRRGGHGMGNTAVQDTGRKPYELRHIHPLQIWATVGGRASGKPERWGSATDRDVNYFSLPLSLSLSLSLSVALSLLSTTVESHILVFNCCATTKYLWHHACKGEKLSLYRPLGVEEV